MPGMFSPGGPLRYANVHMCEQRFEIYPKHILVKMPNSPLNKDFVEFCLKFDPLNRFESKKLEQILTKPPPFSLKHGILDL